MLNDGKNFTRWWVNGPGDTVLCQLCPRGCRISPDGLGFCGVRKNTGGELVSLAYGHPVAIAVDPIEKKPLRHFLPGSKTFSIGTYGCNLDCSCCQNSSLSRAFYDPAAMPAWVPPEQLPQLARKYDCPSVSYTYNEPTIFAEYAYDIAVQARGAGLKNILVSNGYISPAAADALYPVLDAANIDMKGFSEDFYHRHCGASLAPVLASLERLYRLGKHLEITTLVIPGQNDSTTMLEQWLDWVEKHLNRDIPLHFSAYHPSHHCTAPATPADTLRRFRDIAQGRGFTAIYLGNL